MSDSKVQVRRNHKVFFLKNCNQRIKWLKECIKKEERCFYWLENNQHLNFLKFRLKEELKYKKKLSQQITATTC